MLEMKYYDMARQIMRVSDLMDHIHDNIMLKTARSLDIPTGDLVLTSYNDKADAMFYEHYPIVDHKIAWGTSAFGYNYVAAKPVQKDGYRDVIIFDPMSPLYYENINDRDLDVEYRLNFEEPDEFLFQMQMILGKRFDNFCVLYALHTLQYSKSAYIHMFSPDIYDKVIENLEIYIVRQKY